MLPIKIPSRRMYNSQTNEFFYTPAQELRLEHSLMSVQAWESKWHKPFFSKIKKTREQSVDYVRCMTINKDVNPECYKYLTSKNMADIVEYIEDPMTATWFGDDGIPKKPNREIITAEVLYAYMIGLNIPFEARKWHLNQLMTLIKVCSELNSPKGKRNRAQQARYYHELNEERKARLNTKG